MSRTLANSERTAALHDRQTYRNEAQYDHEYLSSNLVQGILSQIVAEGSDVSQDALSSVISILDQSDGSTSREQILMEFPDRRGEVDYILDRLRYYCLTLEAEMKGEKIIGLHPNGEQAARRGYEADRTRKAVLN